MRAAFATLEKTWRREQTHQLYKAVYHAEVEYAIRFHIYDCLRTGNKTVLSIAKDRTRNRMRTRLQNLWCIGLPEIGRAISRKRKRPARVRVDPQSRQIISWKAFCRKAPPSHDLREKWRALPRLHPKAKRRVWNGYVFSWGQCVHWYRDYFPVGYLYEWFRSLERGP